jgi:hypothetical protein
MSWLRRSTLPLADNCREFLNRNLSALPEGCQKGIAKHLRHEQHRRDGFFELIVGRTLQELGADIECEPANPTNNKRPDFLARFPDGTAFVEAVSPVLDRELAEISGREAPLTKLVKDNVPSGWAAIIRALPNVGPDESRRHIKAFLQREMYIPPPESDDEEVEIRETFEQGDLRIILFPQSRHGLSANTKIAMYNAVGYFPSDRTVLRGAVQRKYAQLSKLEGTTLVALNMSSTTSSREDLDQALFGVTVSQIDWHGNEVGRYFQADGLFAGGRGKPTISGVLAFPEVGFMRCADPILWVHPRFEGDFPSRLKDLEIRNMPDLGVEVGVHQAKRTEVLKNLGFVEKK